MGPPTSPLTLQSCRKRHPHYLILQGHWHASPCTHSAGRPTSRHTASALPPLTLRCVTISGARCVSVPPISPINGPSLVYRSLSPKSLTLATKPLSLCATCRFEKRAWRGQHTQVNVQKHYMRTHPSSNLKPPEQTHLMSAGNWQCSSRTHHKQDRAGFGVQGFPLPPTPSAAGPRVWQHPGPCAAP